MGIEDQTSNSGVPDGWQNINEGKEAAGGDAEEKETKKFKARMAMTQQFLEGTIPEKTPDDFLISVAERYHKRTEELNDDEIGEARSAQRSYLFYKNDAVSTIARTEVPEYELGEYITTVFELARELSPKAKEISYEDIRNFGNRRSLGEAKLYREFAGLWKEKILVDISDEERRRRIGDLKWVLQYLSGETFHPKPEERNEGEQRELFRAFLETYDFVYSHAKDVDARLINEFRGLAVRAGLEQHDADVPRRMLRILRKVVAGEDVDSEVLSKFVNAVGWYASHHGLDEESIHGFLEKLLPALQRNDPQVEVVLRGGNAWAMHKGEFGAADFICHCYARRLTPPYINELLLALRQVPTTVSSKLEQNRLDALTLAKPFGILRDFIHDQRPHIHAVIAAMVDYYDSGKGSELRSLLFKTDYLRDPERQRALLDRSLYETEVEERTKIRGATKNVKPIDILRRLAENTKSIPDNPPATSDKVLNKKMRVLSAADATSKKEALGELLKYVNQDLIKKMQQKEIGLDPNTVLVIAWLDRRARELLQSLTYEEQVGAYQQPWFLSLMRFTELTSSAADFREKEFKTFAESIKGAPSYTEAYKLVAGRVLKNVGELAKLYGKRGRKDTGELWSGNLVHELIGLIDLKPAATELGRKFVREDVLRRRQPGYHPGD